MAYKNLIAFGAGEITPELFERGNLEKFRTGLQRLRNATVTKMGGLKGRAGTIDLHGTKDNAAAKFLYIQSRNLLLEFTNGNCRAYEDYDPEFDTFGTVTDIDLSLLDAGDDVTKMHFTNGNEYVYIFADGVEAIRINIDKIIADPLNAVSAMRYNVEPPNPWAAGATAMSYTAGGTAPTGYDIDYAVTFVYQGVETFTFSVNQTRKKPAGTGEHNIISAVITKSFLAAGTLPPDELRVYQRPRDGGGFLFVGNSQSPTENATTITFTFKDFGVEPVADDLPPQYVSLFSADTKTGTTDPGQYYYKIACKTGLVYQDRLAFSGSLLKNRAFATRTGITAMTRDYPLQADSAVSFKVGSDGGLKINRFFDGPGLMIFTSVGVYVQPADQLTPDTAYAIKRAPYVADDAIEPKQLGQYITIYDRRLKAVIGLTPTGNTAGFAYDEFSIYSNHLIKNRRIVSWDLQEGDTSILWMVLDDGKVLSFSFQNEQQVRSWAWHDFQDGKAEEVFVMDLEDGKDVVCFCVNRGGTRRVERLTDRDASFLDYCGTDASKRYKLNVMLDIAALNAEVAPVTPGVWDGPLTITPELSVFGEAPGDILRVYTNGNYEFVDLTVTDNTLGVLTVTPSSEYPESLADLTIDQGIWKVFKVLDGLEHLEGKKVSVRLDGFTHASPLNTDKNYAEYTVTGGQIELEGDNVGASITVGLPIVTDIQTLPIDTVEQAPTKLEGQIVNNLWLSYFESLFLYAAANYPDDNTVTGMDVQEFQIVEDTDTDILSTQPVLPITELMELQISSDWKAKGSVSLRNVDPQPIALRAIIPDTQVERK